MKVEYLPGELNVSADWNSRNMSGFSDWKLERNCFGKINSVWGRLEVDLFAG